MGAVGTFALSFMAGKQAATAALPGLAAPPPAPQAQPLLVEGPDPAAAGAKAGEQQRKKAAAGTGRSDTVKTGPAGLGEVPQENQERKTLLGY